MPELILWVGSLFFGAITFLFGKSYSQTENVIIQKRRVYEEFLKLCPAPNEAHFRDDVGAVDFQRFIGVMTIYGSEDVIKFAAEYFQCFANAQELLEGVEVAGHPEFLRVMTDYNRMVWAMRNDAMMWSFFAPKKSARTYKPSIGPNKAN